MAAQLEQARAYVREARRKKSEGEKKEQCSISRGDHLFMKYTLKQMLIPSFYEKCR
jgi:hypothetical protein